MAPRYLVTIVALAAILAAYLVAVRTLPDVAMGWCVDACGPGGVEYVYRGECECRSADHPEYGR